MYIYTYVPITIYNGSAFHKMPACHLHVCGIFFFKKLLFVLINLAKKQNEKVFEKHV
jgi:hypothetical protein